MAPRGNVQVNEKRCSTCARTLLLDEFYVNTSASGKRLARSECKDCVKAKRRAYRAARPTPDRREYKREWRKRNAERVRAQERAQTARDPDRRRAVARASYWRHVEEARRRAWAQNQRRRGVPMDALAKAWWDIVRMDPCAYCGAREEQTIEHITPISAGGDSAWMNLTNACRTCNFAKHTKPLLRFLAERVAA